MSDPDYVLDASALLALLLDEPGALTIAPLLTNSCVSAVNISEVAAKLVERGASEADVRASLEDLDLDIRPFTQEHALLAGWLRPATRPVGLSLGDRACIALAKAIGAEAVTTDTAWLRVPLQVRIRLIER